MLRVYAPYGLHAKGDKDPHKYPTTRFSYEDLYKRVAVTPTLAWNLNERLRFGLGVSIGRSEMEAGRSYTANPFIAAPFLKAKKTVDNPAEADPADLAKAQKVVNAFGPIFMAEAPGAIYDLRLETEDDLNISWNAGIQYDATDRLSFGLSYRSRTETDFEGDILFQAPGGAQQKVGTVKIDMDHPEQFQFGLRYEVTPKLAVSTDIVHTKWSVNERQQETLNFTTPVGVPDAPTPYPADFFRDEVLAGMNTLDGYDRDWKDEFQYKFGVEYVLNDMFTLRGGYAYDPTPVPESTFDTGWPDTNRHIFDLGAGITLSQEPLHRCRLPAHPLHGLAEGGRVEKPESCHWRSPRHPWHAAEQSGQPRRPRHPLGGQRHRELHLLENSGKKSPFLNPKKPSGFPGGFFYWQRQSHCASVTKLHVHESQARTIPSPRS